MVVYGFLCMWVVLHCLHYLYSPDEHISLIQTILKITSTPATVAGTVRKSTSQLSDKMKIARGSLGSLWETLQRANTTQPDGPSQTSQDTTGNPGRKNLESTENSSLLFFIVYIDLKFRGYPNQH